MTQEDYGSEYRAHLLEQYKAYTAATVDVTAKRMQVHGVFVSLLSAILVMLSLFIRAGPPKDVMTLAIVLISFVALLFCAVWWTLIRSYRQLNKSKFAVIHEMEKQLPYPCYAREWEQAGGGQDPKKYRPISRIEQWLPIVVGLPYAVVFLIYAYCWLFG